MGACTTYPMKQQKKPSTSLHQADLIGDLGGDGLLAVGGTLAPCTGAPQDLSRSTVTVVAALEGTSTVPCGPRASVGPWRGRARVGSSPWGGWGPGGG